MRTIYKYEVKPEMTVPLPAAAQPLTVQVQGDTPQLWVLLDPEAPMTPRTFHTYGTGHPVENGRLEYIATFQLNEGALVFHTFEVLHD